MQTNNSPLPINSALNVSGQQYDFSDCFSAIFLKDGKDVTIEDVGASFFLSTPTWIKLLLAIRNIIVRPFGLKTNTNIHNKQKLVGDFKFEPGEQYGIFKVYSRTQMELIVGQKDKHLDFKVSLLLNKTTLGDSVLIISTVVSFHNRLGKLYFLFVKPFHKLIVPSTLKSMVRHLSQISLAG